MRLTQAEQIALGLNLHGVVLRTRNGRAVALTAAANRRYSYRRYTPVIRALPRNEHKGCGAAHAELGIGGTRGRRTTHVKTAARLLDGVPAMPVTPRALHNGAEMRG